MGEPRAFDRREVLRQLITAAVAAPIVTSFAVGALRPLLVPETLANAAAGGADARPSSRGKAAPAGTKPKPKSGATPKAAKPGGAGARPAGGNAGAADKNPAPAKTTRRTGAKKTRKKKDGVDVDQVIDAAQDLGEAIGW